MKSFLFVLVQFACMGVLLLTGPLVARPLPLLLLQGMGLLLGGWAVWVMRRSRLSVLPDVAPGSVLIREGPYRWLRHPMYTAVLLVLLALVLAQPDGWRMLVWGLLLTTLVWKLHYEEALLAARFEEYPAYWASTWRLVPWLY
jgi:protein-S-isoprenylcysteine O-methyltransferase Ste14